MPRLLELEAEFLQVIGPKTYQRVKTLGEAHGICFLCPKCFAENKGSIGTHSVICWSRSRGTPNDIQPLPGRWRMDGNDLNDLTLNAEEPNGARSVLLLGGCGWHGFVDNGNAE